MDYDDMMDFKANEEGWSRGSHALDQQFVTDVYDDLPPEEARELINEVSDRLSRCSFCGTSPMRPTGSCYTCPSCGETTGCS
jgi:hypothetical protein